jgi:hypothetical protein
LIFIGSGLNGFSLSSPPIKTLYSDGVFVVSVAAVIFLLVILEELAEDDEG